MAPSSSQVYKSEPIVVVGTGCRFPGDIRSPSQLWESIIAQKDLLTPIPSSRFNTKGFHHSNGERHGSTNVNHAYLLNDDIAAFDAGFFGINPREAEAIDPQQRMLLETVYEAMDNAGLTISNMEGSDTAVYVGLMTGDWHEMQIRDPENMPMYMATGTARSIVSNRVSYFFDWKGPSMTIDTACSSSLVALHHAVQSLRSGDCRVAVAAGANLILGPEMMIAEANLHMLSPTGRSRMWDANADGYARGEGFAAVMLKTLSQALADGDTVEYIIRETGVNQDGRTQGITMPNAESQTALIRQVYSKAGLDCMEPEDQCQFFEAHGTGTPRGDPIEARAIRDAFFPNSTIEDTQRQMYVGSVKTVIGHLEGCAGLAGVLKAGEAVRLGQIPPNMHYSTMNPDIVPFSRHLQVPTRTVEWPSMRKGVRRASVNSFGFGGTNAHVIIESYDQTEPVALPSSDALPLPLVLSANSEVSLTSMINDYAMLLKSDGVIPLHEIAVTLASRRSQHPVRATFSGLSPEKLIHEMETALAGPTVGDRKQTSSAPPRLLGVFTGQGAQWMGMGRELLATSPMARETVTRLQASLNELPNAPAWTIEAQLTQNEDPSAIQEAVLSQPLCTAVQVMLVNLLRAAGVSFYAVVGHSSGEIGAAYAAGMISARDAIRIAYYRGVYAKLAHGETGEKGAMMAVGISFAEAQEFIRTNGFEGRIAVAASNAPKSVTLSGDEGVILEAETMFKESETFCRLLKVDTAYHSQHMIPCLEPYCAALRNAGVTPLEGSSDCRWVSSVHGRLMDKNELDSLKETYWGDNMANTVLFSQAVQAATQNHGPFTAGLEVGPHPALKGPVTQTTKEETGLTLPYTGSLARFGNDVEALSAALGFLWKELGADSVDLRQFGIEAFGLTFQTSNSTCKQLPRYTWDHSQRFWKESRVSRRYRQRSSNRHDLLGARCQDDHNSEMRWRNTLRVAEAPWLSGHKVQGQVIFPAAGYLVMAMEAAKELAGDRPVAMVHLTDVHIDRAIAVPEDRGVEVMFHLQPVAATGSTLKALFSCYAAPSGDEDAKWQRNVSGVVHVHAEDTQDTQLPSRQEEEVDLVPVRIESFYESLSDIGLQYTGLFQRLNRVVRRSKRATGFALDIPCDEEMPVTIHPALLDASFQTIFAAFCWPGDGSLQGPYVPTHLRSLRIIPAVGQGQEEMTVECSLSESLAQTVTADVDIFTPVSPRVQLEGLTCTRLDPATPDNDCELFAQTVWNADAGAGLSAADLPADQPEDLELVDLCERLSYSYLRLLNAEVDRNEVPSFIWHHQRIFEFIDYLFPLIESGEHPTIRSEWKNDDHSWLLSQAKRFPDNVDLQLISAVGKNLADVVRGKTTMLEHMVVDDTLNRFYKYGLGFQRANGALSRVARQIAHRYPRMRVLEIGAGTGGATKGVLERLGDAFEEYVFTDISAGFFERAKEQFAPWANRMVFSTLNIEEELEAQGFEDSSFDMIVASNVLHATKTLDYTMQNVRRLLKPGGFLLLLEVTSDILRVKLMMAGLSGWWLGADDGRRYAPTITASQWNDLLIKTGFSGVDSQIPDFQETSKHMTSVMIAQAMNPDVAALRNPLSDIQSASAVDRLVIVGGQAPAVQGLAKQCASMLSRWSTEPPVIVSSFEEFAKTDTGSGTAVVCLADLDGPVLWGMTDDRLASLKELLNSCRFLVWVTGDARKTNPYGNMSIGLGRSLMYEYPHIRMQFVDLAGSTGSWDGYASRVATAMARTILGGKLELPSSRVLWSVEPEVAVEGECWMIPRILPNERLNRRLNAQQRTITEEVSLAESSVRVVGDGNEVWLERQGGKKMSTWFGLRELVVTETSLTALSIGALDRLGCPVLALTAPGSASSSSTVPASSVLLPLDNSQATPSCLRLIALALPIISYLDQLASRNVNGNVLLVEPDATVRRLVHHLVSSRGLELTVVSFTAGHKDTLYIPPLLPLRLIRARLPTQLLCLLDCSPSTEGHVLDALHHPYTFRLRDAFQLPSKDGHSSAIPSWETALEALKLASACTDATVTSLTIISPSAVSDAVSCGCPSVIDYISASTASIRVLPTDPNTLFRSDRSYLLVGCTGGLGQSLSRWMVQNGTRHLIMTSRNLKNINRMWVDELKRMGAQIHLFQLDIADKPALHAMYSKVQRELPPIAGVANAAMVLSDRLFNDMALDDLTKVLNPKVAGTAHLDELFSTPTLDFFVLFSSLASVVGNRGQANYGAANLFMTSLAARRKSQGLAGSVLDIGMVLGIGYVSQTGIYESTLRKFNYMPISEPKFHVMFTEAIVAGRPNETESPAEIITGLHRIADAAPGSEGQAFWAGNPRFSHYTLREKRGTENATATIVALKKQLAEVEDVTAATQVVSEGFTAKLGRILQVALENINPAQPLISLGVDSLMAVEIRSWFVMEMDVDVPVLRILGGASPIDLCQEAAERYMTPRVSVSPATSSSRETSLSRSAVLEPSQAVSSATSHTGTLSLDGGKDQDEFQSVQEELLQDEDDLKVLDSSRMSFAQERLWFLREFLDDPTTYNVTMMYKVCGPTASNLSAAFNAVVHRHHVLRSAYHEDQATGVPSQSVLQLSSFRLTQQTGLSTQEEITAEFQKLCDHTYDLERGECIVATLCSHSADTHTLVLGFHHIVFDGFSAQVFVKDLATALSRQHLPPLQYQYADFARRQRSQVEESAMADDIAYWKNVFSSVPEPMPLLEFCQVVNRRPLNEYTTHVVRTVLPTSTVTAWKETVRQAGTTPFHGHLAVVQLLLSRFLSREEICIGFTDANRTDSDFLDNIGFFVNLLPLRFKVDKHKSFVALLKNTRDVTYQALQHSRVPFDVLLDALAVPRSTTESPLFQILMNYKMGSSTTIKMPGFEAHLLQFKDASNPYDLVFDIEERTDGTTLIDLKSQSYLYSQDDLKMLLDAYSSVLTSCTESPIQPLEKHCFYKKGDVDTTICLGTGPNLELDETITLTHRIDQTITEQPDDVAIKDNEGRALTYSQMSQRIHSIAATLFDSGTRAGDFVAVYCEPSLNSVCYLLAIWRLNAIYVPLDPQNPVQRLQLILNDCQPKVLIFDSATEKATGEFEFSAAAELITFSNFANTETIPNDAQPASAACALYTSGSTGVPKGIVLSHASFYNQILGVRHQFSVGRETVLQQSSLGFDVSLDQMLQPLVGGGTLVVAPRYLRGDAVELARLMASEKVSYTYATPSEYAALLSYAGDVLAQSPSWRFAVVGGEALPPHLIRSFHALSNPGLRLINRSCLSIDTWDPAVLDIERVSVGYSLPNYATYILGSDGSPLPVGYAGEIVVAGCGVAQGYLGKEDLTRERFLVDPFNATAQASTPRMYRTGDKGRFLPNGELMYLGRVDGDTQIKLRGFRVELADIGQTILRESGGRLADAVISVRGVHDEDGDSPPVTPYMIPRQIVIAEDLPRNPNGKLDRRALDQLPLPASTTSTEELEKLTPAQKIVADAWRKCLNPSTLPTSLAPSADFFELGGNSLLMIRLQALLSEGFGQRLPLRDLFQSSTVQGMAARFAPEEQLDQLTSGIDWEEEITVGETERSIASSSVPKPSNGHVEVCLTGATGFLGSAILRNLVADSRIARIHCLAIRSSDPSRPRTLTVESEKIIAYPGDLALPLLGLDQSTWDLLASKATCIIHNGADVSFLKSYQSLRKSNLYSTRELTKLALNGGIPFHFVSSGGVAQLVPTVESLGPRSVKQHQPLTDGSMGYIAAKWASEAYLESCAVELKLPVSIHRPSSIVGEGVPATDLVRTILELSLKTMTLPTLDSWGGSFDFVPVEDVAAGICESVPTTTGAGLEPKLQFIHHCSDEKVPVSEIGAYLEKTHGVELKTVDVEEWLEGARKAGLSGALDDLVMATFQGSERHFMPSLAE
ncbi:hypothetical protein BDW69DRAFT_183550 [Aspergillus filifer]